MVSTYTTNKSIEKPAAGDYSNTWATPANTDYDIIDTALGGNTSINVVAVSGTVALTLTQYRPPYIVFTGLLTANVDYQLPSGIGGRWTLYNGTTGAFTVTFSSAGGGTSVVLQQGYLTTVICDGTNVRLANNSPVNPGGSTTQVQYNSSGLLAGSANFTYDGSAAFVMGTTGTPGTLTLTSTLRLGGTTSGYVGLKGAAVAGSTTYTLPAADGTASQLLSTDGAGTLSWTSVSSGVTSITFGTTGLTPSGVGTGAVTVAGTLVPANGGTGLSSYAVGDLLYASASTTLSKLAGVATGNALISGGVTTAPSWGKIGLTTHVSGVLGVANGGTAVSVAGIAAFNSITGYTAAGATGTTSTNIVFSTSPTITTATLTSPTINGATINAASTVSDSGTATSAAVGFRGSVVNTQNGTYSTVNSDCGKTIYHTSGSAHTHTIDNTVAFDGMIIAWTNENGAGDLTIALSSGTMYWGSSTGSRVLGANTTAQVQRMSSTVWRFTGDGTIS